MAKKRKNVQDATLKNIRLLKKRVARLERDFKAFLKGYVFVECKHKKSKPK